MFFFFLLNLEQLEEEIEFDLLEFEKLFELDELLDEEEDEDEEELDLLDEDLDERLDDEDLDLYLSFLFFPIIFFFNFGIFY